MSDEIANAPAPAAPAAVVEPVSAPTGGTVASSSAGAPPAAAPSPASTPDTPAFAWSDWDGVDSSLPEHFREGAGHIRSRFEQDYSRQKEEIEELRSVYTAMLNEEEDPRIGKMTSELEDLRGQLGHRNSDFEQLQGYYKELSDVAVQDYVEQFWQHHAHIKEDSAKLERFGAFMAEEGDLGGPWDGYVAAKLIDLPEEVLQVAIEAKRDGVSDEYAYRLAEAQSKLLGKETAATEAKQAVAKEIKKAASKPRPASKITNGATGGSRPAAAEASMSGTKTLDEMRGMAAKRALKVHSGGKR